MNPSRTPLSLGNYTPPASNLTETDVLYNLAFSQGGALGDAAANLRDPKTSFFREVGSNAKNALLKVADALQTPLNMVTGLMDPNTTIREAMEKNLTPGDLLFDKPLKSDSAFSKTGYFVGKFVVDTLFDPLTYVTFGASKGIMGLSRGAEAIAGAKLSQQMALKEGSRVYLTEAGEDAATKLLQAKRRGLQHTHLLNERIKLVNKGLPEAEINARMRDVESSMSDFLIKETFGDTLDAGNAAQTIANLAGAKPHLMQKFIDQGGVKMFGQTLLQGQKIRAAAAAIPGMTLLDRAVEPVRRLVGNTFSVQYQNGVRMSDEYMGTEQKWRNIYESSRHDLVRNAINLKKQLNLSNEEWEFVTAAVERGLRPADPKGADLWNILHKMPPENGTIPDRVWQGLIGVNRLNKLALKKYREAGLKMRNQDGYMPHILRESEAGVSAYAPRIPSVKTDRGRFATVSTFVDESGNRLPAKLLSRPDPNGKVKALVMRDGELKEEVLTYRNSALEIERIERIAKEKGERLRNKIEGLRESINERKGIVKGALVDDTAKAIESLISDVVGLSKEEKTNLSKIVAEYIDNPEVSDVVTQRMLSRYKDGIKMRSGSVDQEVTAKDIKQLIEDSIKKEQSANEVAEALRSRMRPVPTTQFKKTRAKETPASTTATPETDIAKLAEEIKKQTKAAREAILKESVNEDALKQMIAKTIDSFGDRPGPLTQALDKIVRDSQLVQELGEEFTDVARSIKFDTEEAISQGGKFVTESGKVLERVRAQVTESKQLGFNFEDNALALSLINSADAIKVATTKEFMDDLVRHFGMPESMAPGSYVPIEKVGMQFEGQDLSSWLVVDKGDRAGDRLLFPPEIAERVTAFTLSLNGGDAATEAWKRGYDGLQNYIKAAVTAIFPAFHGRNAISNVFLMYNTIGTEALNPVNHALAGKIMNLEMQAATIAKKIVSGKAEPKEMAELALKEVFTDRTGYRWTWGELRSVIHKNLVAFEPKNLGFIDNQNFNKDLISETAERIAPTTRKGEILNKVRPFNPLDQDNALFSFGFAIGRTIEDYSRTVAFLANLRKTGDPIQAARATKMALFDYSSLTKFERNFLRRIIPFYCVPETTEALTRTGWKHHSSISVGEEVLTYNVTSDQYEWQPVLEKFVAPYSDYMTNLKSKRYSLSATFNHRWVVEDYKNDVGISRGYELNTGHKIKTSSKYLNEDSKWSVDDARLLGWLLTDGYFRFKGNYCEAMIYQHPKKFLKEVTEIAGGTPRKPHPDSGVVCVPVLKERVQRIKHLLNRDKRKDNWCDFVGELGRVQLEAMYDAMYKADGTTSLFRTQDSFACQLDGVGETFQMLATLLGKRAIKSTNQYYVSNSTRLGVKDFWKEHYYYEGNVWCPRTSNGTWVMRQNGFVTITGNTFSRKNMELQVRTLFTNPGKVGQQIRAVQTFGEALGGGELTQEEMEALPEWAQRGYSLVIDRDPSHVTLLNSIGTPIEEAFSRTNADANLGIISPLVKVPIELLTGYNTFYGRPISELTNADAYQRAPGFIKDFIGYEEVRYTNPRTGKEETLHTSFAPWNMNLINSFPPAGRFWNEVKRIENAPDSSAQLRALFFGIGTREFDVEAEQQRRLLEEKRKLEALLTQAKIGYTFTRYVEPTTP